MLKREGIMLMSLAILVWLLVWLFTHGYYFAPLALADDIEPEAVAAESGEPQEQDADYIRLQDEIASVRNAVSDSTAVQQEMLTELRDIKAQGAATESVSGVVYDVQCAQLDDVVSLQMLENFTGGVIVGCASFWLLWHAIAGAVNV